MAYTKKSDTTIKKEVENVNPVKTAAKETVKENDATAQAIAVLQEQMKMVLSQNADFKEQNDTLKAQNEMLMKLLTESRTAAAPVIMPQNVLDNTVTVVHLCDREPGLSTSIRLSNRAIEFHTFGEEVTLDLRQAEELAGSYRNYFEKGWIAFGAGSEEIAHRFGLKAIKDYPYYTRDFVAKLATLSTSELEALYNKVAEGHKELIIQYFKRKIIEGNPAFKNIYKVEMLNRVSNGAMSNVLLDFKREAEQTAQK